VRMPRLRCGFTLSTSQLTLVAHFCTRNCCAVGLDGRPLMKIVEGSKGAIK